jgi:hypothetical protein
MILGYLIGWVLNHVNIILNAVKWWPIDRENTWNRKGTGIPGRKFPVINLDM